MENAIVVSCNVLVSPAYPISLGGQGWLHKWPSRSRCRHLACSCSSLNVLTLVHFSLLTREAHFDADGNCPRWRTHGWCIPEKLYSLPTSTYVLVHTEENFERGAIFLTPADKVAAFVSDGVARLPSPWHLSELDVGWECAGSDFLQQGGPHLGSSDHWRGKAGAYAQ